MRCGRWGEGKIKVSGQVASDTAELRRLSHDMLTQICKGYALISGKYVEQEAADKADKATPSAQAASPADAAAADEMDAPSKSLSFGSAINFKSWLSENSSSLVLQPAYQRCCQKVSETYAPAEKQSTDHASVLLSIIRTIDVELKPEWIHEVCVSDDNSFFFNTNVDVADFLKLRSKYVLSLVDAFCAGPRRISSEDLTVPLRCISDNDEKVAVLARVDATFDGGEDLFTMYRCVLSWACDLRVSPEAEECSEKQNNYTILRFSSTSFRMVGSWVCVGGGWVWCGWGEGPSEGLGGCSSSSLRRRCRGICR